MFKISHNRAVLSFTVETVTPLSIRASSAGLDPTGADLTCVRTHHHVHGRTVYIPGSSLKGVVRSAIEANLRGREFEHLGGQTIEGACDPTDHHESCARHSPRSNNRPDTAGIHRKNCAACRTFGSLSLRGRCAIRDLFPFPDSGSLAGPDRENLTRANRVEVRHGVFIGRITGSVEVGPFDQEMVPAGTCFYGEVALQNYQAWQLGLLFAAFDELSEGFVQLGSSKTRGLGVVRVNTTALIHEQRLARDTRPLGLAALADDASQRSYGLFAEEPLPESNGLARGLSRRFEVRDPAALDRWRQATSRAVQRLEATARGAR